MTEEAELPSSMGKVARRALSGNGLTRLEQFDGVSAAQLLAIHGVGPKAIRILGEHLAADGRSLAP